MPGRTIMDAAYKELDSAGFCLPQASVAMQTKGKSGDKIPGETTTPTKRRTTETMKTMMFIPRMSAAGRAEERGGGGVPEPQRMEHHRTEHREVVESGTAPTTSIAKRFNFTPVGEFATATVGAVVFTGAVMLTVIGTVKLGQKWGVFPTVEQQLEAIKAGAAMEG